MDQQASQYKIIMSTLFVLHNLRIYFILFYKKTKPIVIQNNGQKNMTIQKLKDTFPIKLQLISQAFGTKY